MNSDQGTYEQILRLIVERGPITAGDLAKILVLTPAAVRRHIGVLVKDDYIEEYDGPAKGPARRGRPSRQYVATAEGQSQLGQGYSDLASHALGFVRDSMGEEGLERFIHARARALEQRYGPMIDAAGTTSAERAAALTDALSKDGYVATLRRGGPNALSIQIAKATAQCTKLPKNTRCCARPKRKPSPACWAFPSSGCQQLRAADTCVPRTFRLASLETCEIVRAKPHALRSVLLQHRPRAASWKETDDPNRTG